LGIDRGACEDDKLEVAAGLESTSQEMAEVSRAAGQNQLHMNYDERVH
jgi:hypothetical protein